MAEIDVVRKGSRAWLWVVLLVVLAIILWVAFAGTGTRETGRTTTGQARPFAATVSPVTPHA